MDTFQLALRYIMALPVGDIHVMQARLGTLKRARCRWCSHHAKHLQRSSMTATGAAFATGVLRAVKVYLAVGENKLRIWLRSGCRPTSFLAGVGCTDVHQVCFIIIVML